MEFLNILNSRAFDSLHIPDDWRIDYQGWMDHEFLKVFDNALDGKSETVDIVEVGTWKGLSAMSMTERCILKNLKPRIVTVDTWLGAPEFWDNQDDRERDLMFVNGYPSVFYTFTKNVKSLGISEYIYPLPISSTQGAEVLKKHNFLADIIYIDASHEYEPVKSDIEAYWKLLKPGGIMIGDDYDWPGVKKAVDEIGNFNVHGRVWSMVKTS